MKSYLGLVPISARVHKRQSRMTRICIVLAVFLVTSVCSMAEMWIKAEKTAMVNKHGNYHIILQNVQSDKAGQIRQRSDILFSSAYREINSEVDKSRPDTGQSYYINDTNVVLYGIEETYLTDIMNYPIEGSYPQNNKEIALSADAKKLWEVDTGDAVILNTPKGDFSFTISAFCEDDAEFNKIIDGCCVYMNLPTFQTVSALNKETAAPKYYICFAQENRLGRTISDIKEQYGLTDANIDENTAVLGLTGASSSDYIKNIYALAAVCFVLILISGILMISGCINSTVAQRTSFFGMMRCIGASKRQITHFVRLEALNWCKSAIPVGCLSGTMVCWILCAILRFLVKGEFVDMPLFGVSVGGILCGIAVGIITVFIAAHSPAKQAAKVSPIAAVSGNMGKEMPMGKGMSMKKKTGHRAINTRFFKIETALGIHHAAAAKKNLFLLTGSFALTIILFLAFSACFDIIRNLLPSKSNFSPDIAITSQDGINSIDQSLVAQISEIPGVKRVFGTMYAIAIPVKINGNETIIDLISYDQFLLKNMQKSVASGNLSKVYGNSRYAFTIFSESSRINVGDKIEIDHNDLEISCVASEGIGSVSGSAVVVCSEDTFTRLMGTQGYMMVNIILDKNATEETMDQICDLAGEHPVTDRREETSVVYSSYWVVRIAVYGFLAIISFITVLNIINSVSMSVSARIKLYGAMRAVGMESRQITKMILSETATYALCGMIVGIMAGLTLHYLIYVKIVISHFGGSWKIPVGAIGIIFLLVAVSCVAAVYGPAKRIHNMTITATINEL